MTSIRHSEKQAWWLAAVICILTMTLAAVVALGVKEISDEHEQSDDLANSLLCIGAWANNYTIRAERIAKLDDDRSSALDALVRSIPTRSATQFEKALKVYLKASDAYDQAIKNNPIPQAPHFACKAN